MKDFIEVFENVFQGSKFSILFNLILSFILAFFVYIYEITFIGFKENGIFSTYLLDSIQSFNFLMSIIIFVALFLFLTIGVPKLQLLFFTKYIHYFKLFRDNHVEENPYEDNNRWNYEFDIMQSEGRLKDTYKDLESLYEKERKGAILRLIAIRLIKFKNESEPVLTKKGVYFVRYYNNIITQDLVHRASETTFYEEF